MIRRFMHQMITTVAVTIIPEVLSRWHMVLIQISPPSFTK